MCFSCRPFSTSSVFIRKYTSFFVRKCGRWTFWTCGMWSPIRLKKYVIHAFASATFGSFSSTDSFSPEQCNPFKKLVKQLLIPLSWDSKGRHKCVPTDKLSFQHNCRILGKALLTSDLEGIKDELVLLGSCSWLKFLPGMLYLNNAEMGQTCTSTAAVA